MKTRQLVLALKALIRDTLVLEHLVNVTTPDRLPPAVVQEKAEWLRQSLRKFFVKVAEFPAHSWKRHLLRGIIEYSVAAATLAEASRFHKPGSFGHASTWNCFAKSIERAKRDWEESLRLLSPGGPDNGPGQRERFLRLRLGEADTLLRKGRRHARRDGIEFSVVPADHDNEHDRLVLLTCFDAAFADYQQHVSLIMAGKEQ